MFIIRIVLCSILIFTLLFFSVNCSKSESDLFLEMSGVWNNDIQPSDNIIVDLVSSEKSLTSFGVKIPIIIKSVDSSKDLVIFQVKNSPQDCVLKLNTEADSLTGNKLKKMILRLGSNPETTLTFIMTYDELKKKQKE